MANVKQEGMAAVSTLRGGGLSGINDATGRAQDHLKEEFHSQFDHCIDQLIETNDLVTYRNGSTSSEIDKTDICMFQGLFGIRGNTFPYAMMGDMVEGEEGKSFFYHAVKGDLNSIEVIDPISLNDLLTAMQNYEHIFHDNTKDEIIHWLVFEANQAYQRINLKPSDLDTGKKRAKSGPKRGEDELKDIISIKNESLKENLVALKNHLELFLEKNTPNSKVLQECNDFIKKILPLETDTLLGKVKRRERIG